MDEVTKKILTHLELKLKENPYKAEKMDSFEVNNEDIAGIMALLKEFGEVESDINEYVKGPILVIFKERHSNNNVKRQNFLAFQKTIDYYNFLGTEGENGELIGTGLEETIINTEKMIDFILSGNFNLSSEAIESYYGDKIQTFGIDLPGFIVKSLRAKANELAYNIALAGLGENNPDLKKEAEKVAQKIFDTYLETITNGRNIIWLENTIRILKNTHHINGKNFIAIVGGVEHAENLGKRALDMGFKGSIVFTPNSLTKQ